MLHNVSSCSITNSLLVSIFIAGDFSKESMYYVVASNFIPPFLRTGHLSFYNIVSKVCKSRYTTTGMPSSKNCSYMDSLYYKNLGNLFTILGSL